MSRLLSKSAFIVLGLSASLAGAKPFSTQFMSVQLPPNWDCKQEEMDWVCQPDNLSERSEAIVIIVTKAVNETDDTFEKYESTLKATRPMRDLLGNSYESQVKYTRRREIKGQPWIDSLHLGSEIPGFFTRYIASIKEKVAGMLTYSVAESVYPKYSAVLDQMVDSLEIHFDPKAFADAMKSNSGPIMSKSRTAGPGRLAPTMESDKGKDGKGMDTMQIAGILVALAAVGYLIWKKKKGGGTPAA
ncbi:MAG: hypothetical protein JST16_04265 [Bdellovibrionales bacterium]|nr:hypothetical protein [Bdellovibrionales bacterium]